MVIPSELNASLTVLADGGHSPLGDQFSATREDYAAEAVLAFIGTDIPHQGRAYERFTNEGPIALLPFKQNRYAVVWTSKSPLLEQRLAMTDQAFVEALQTGFGDRAGNFHSPSPRKSYALGRLKMDQPIGNRCVVIGNAAHTVHPVAGQGFNLGLRDVAALSECLLQSDQQGIDPGNADTLSSYLSSRQHDTRMVQSFTHNLIQIFTSRNLPLRIARSLALHGVELFPPAKRFLLKRTMGLAGKQPRLARGLSLQPATKNNS